jgi:hypothetical protein
MFFTMTATVRSSGHFGGWSLFQQVQQDLGTGGASRSTASLHPDLEIRYVLVYKA